MNAKERLSGGDVVLLAFGTVRLLLIAAAGLLALYGCVWVIHWMWSHS